MALATGLPPSGRQPASKPAVAAAAPAAADAARKRAALAAPGPLDMLPYQRKVSFKRRAHASLEDRIRTLLGSQAPASEGGSGGPATSSQGTPPPPAQPPRVSIVLGRVVESRDTGRDIMLPLATEAMLEGADHAFEPHLSREAFEALRKRLEDELAAWRGQASAKGGCSTGPRWADITVSECTAPAPLAPKAEITVYCPGGSFHYQVQVGKLKEAPGNEQQQQLQGVMFKFVKDKDPVHGMWWSVSLCSGAEGQTGAFTAEVSVNPSLLWAQHQRMRAGRQHGFSMIVRDLLRNARSLQGFLNGVQVRETDVPLYYPGLFDPATQVKVFYDQKAQSTVDWRKGRAWQDTPSPSDKIRKYNNLIKVIQIEYTVDPMPPPVAVLDVGCGHGQDINKWSRQFRNVRVSKYVGIDFAEAAVEEARRRYSGLLRKVGDEYHADFYAGDLRSDATWEKLTAAGHTTFDVVSIHFVLQYLADSEESTRTLFKRIHGLLRPGGCVIASIPNSDALGELYTRAATGSDARSMKVGNDLYSVHFQDPAWKAVGTDEDALEEAFEGRWGLPYTFTLVDAVDGQEEYNIPWTAFEEMVKEMGFKVSMDATFPELLKLCREKSPFYNNIFAKDASASTLSAAEEELFGLYSGFALERL